MKNKNLFYLIMSLAICSGTMLINRFLVPIPEWLVIVLIVLAAVSLITFIAKSIHK